MLASWMCCSAIDAFNTMLVGSYLIMVPLCFSFSRCVYLDRGSITNSFFHRNLSTRQQSHAVTRLFINCDSIPLRSPQHVSLRLGVCSSVAWTTFPFFVRHLDRAVPMSFRAKFSHVAFVNLSTTFHRHTPFSRFEGPISFGNVTSPISTLSTSTQPPLYPPRYPPHYQRYQQRII